MLYIHAGVHAPAQSGPNSSRPAQTLSFPPKGNQYDLAGEDGVRL